MVSCLAALKIMIASYKAEALWRPQLALARVGREHRKDEHTNSTSPLSVMSGTSPCRPPADTVHYGPLITNFAAPHTRHLCSLRLCKIQ